MPGLSDWLKPHHSRTKFSCAACDKSCELFNKGILALNGTKGHDKGYIANVKLMLENRRLKEKFFKTPGNSASSSTSVFASTSATASTSGTASASASVSASASASTSPSAFTPASASTSPSASTSAFASSAASTVQQYDMTSRIRAEIIWCCRMVKAVYSDNSNEGLTDDL